MTAQVLAFRPRGERGPAPLVRTRLQPATPPRITHIDPWWHCPSFCQDTVCFGGELHEGANYRFTADRRHGALIHAETIRQDDGGYVDVSISLVAVENPREGFMDGTCIIASLGNLETTDADAVQRIAMALDAAVRHAKEPLNPRPASNGAGWAPNVPA